MFGHLDDVIARAWTAELLCEVVDRFFVHAAVINSEFEDPSVVS